MGKSNKVTIRAKGRKPITFERGGLHRSTNTPMGEKIPASKMRAALRGDYGPKARKQAIMAEGLLAKGRRTAAKGR